MVREAILGGFGLVIAAVTATQAQAVKITQTYTFSVGDFTKSTGTGPAASPVASYDGWFTITFNTKNDYTNSTDIVDPSVSIPGIGTFSFSYSQSNGYLYFGGGSRAKAQDFATDFELVIFDPKDSGPLQGTGYIYSGINSLYTAGTVTITAGPRAPATVPEPATWAMMIGGFGLVGMAMRRRTPRTTVAFG